jgi:hypothetical protein
MIKRSLSNFGVIDLVKKDYKRNAIARSKVKNMGYHFEKLNLNKIFLE